MEEGSVEGSNRNLTKLNESLERAETVTSRRAGVSDKNWKQFAMVSLRKGLRASQSPDNR